MRKNLLSIGVLAGFFSVMAQKPVTHIGHQSKFWVGESSLVYNGGGLQTKGDGLFNIHGNVMVVGKSTDKFRTIEANSDADKTAVGDNIVLKLNNPTNHIKSTYGQLYITGITQDNMKALVKKEYKATKHGHWQQMGIPFYGKTLASLATELGSSNFKDTRENPSVMYWDNQGMPQFHNLLSNQSTKDKAAKDNDGILHNNAARYYIVGTQGGWDPSAAVKVVSGQLFSDATPITYTLKGAGYSGTSAIPYGIGTGDVGKSEYNERVKTYLSDYWDYNSQGFFNQGKTEEGTYGRNIYQFANPFMTNIDLSTIGYDEDNSGTGDDKNTLCQLQGVRYESNENSVVTSSTGTVAVDRFITYTSNGIPSGDIENALVKPMQAFAIKMTGNTCQDNTRVLNFNSLRRFAYKVRKTGSNGVASNPYSVVGERNGNHSTVKQLRVVGLDNNGNDIARTYFIVSKEFKSGKNGEALRQVMSWNNSSVYTREELPTGGADLSDPYNTMYINEANETDFEGKKIQMETRLADVKNYRFEIAENANSFTDGQSEFVDGGKSFYIEQAPGQFIKLSHNMIIPATVAKSGLYFGMPQLAQLSTGENKLEADNELQIAYEKESATHQVIFPKKWNKAAVTIFDMSGRRISVNKEVDTSKNFVLPLKVEGAYIVEVVSDKGIKAVKKIVK